MNMITQYKVVIYLRNWVS